MELHYAFLKDNRVVEVAVFASQDQELANRIAEEQGFDAAIWTGETVLTKWSVYDGISFIPPTEEYLISIGVTEAMPEVTKPEIEPLIPEA
jgi:hypothetical protein